MRTLKVFGLIILISAPAYAQVAIEADTIFTVSGAPMLNAVVLVKNGKIEAVGKLADVKIPASYKRYRVNVITPGLVDARSMVGLSGALNIPTDQAQLEKSSPLQPDLRAIDAYNPEDSLVSYLRSWGITTLHTGHGVGALVSGQTMVVKTKPGFTEEVVVVPLAMLAMTFGPDVGENFPSPGTKSKQVAMLRTEMIKAQAYQKKMGDKDETKRPGRDLKLEMLLKLMNGEVKGLISANRATDILSAIRLAREFGFKLVLEGCAEGYRLTEQIKASGAEVIVHATMTRPSGEFINVSMENAALLTKAGIPVSIESGFEGYVPKTRVILFEAAIAAGRGGLPYAEALKAITLNPARLLGLEKRIGSIEKGKDADLVMYTGDPFEYTTKVCGVMIDGVMVKWACE